MNKYDEYKVIKNASYNKVHFWEYKSDENSQEC